MTADVQRELAEAHGPGKCVSVDEANRVLAQERAGVQALIADAEKRAAVGALREAANDLTNLCGPRPWDRLRARADSLDPQ